jgi:hypothetical protein
MGGNNEHHLHCANEAEAFELELYFVVSSRTLTKHKSQFHMQPHANYPFGRTMEK